MALQRIDTAYGPNPVRFNGNIQPQANANVFLGNTSFQFSTIYAGSFSGTATHANLSYFLGSGTAINPSSANVAGNIVGYATTVTANVSTGAIVSRGGLGVAGVGMFGGNVVAASGTASTTTDTGALVVSGGVGISGALNTGGIIDAAGNIVADSGVASTSTTTGAIVVNGGAGVSGAIYTGGAIIGGGNIVAAATTISTSSTTGALVVRGGVGIAGNIYVAGSGGTAINAGAAVVPSVGNTYTLGSTTNAWSFSYSNNVVITGVGAATSSSTGALTVAGGVGIAGNVFTGGWIVPTSNVSQNLGTTTQWWNTFYGVSTQARYADLAENYQADVQYEPGTVLEFGGEFELTVAQDGSRKVAGVVSTNPAHLMNGMLTGPNVVPLALQGRTPCRVRGKISKGDMLISAGGGFARPDNNPQIGTVIGKALEDFDGLEGIIEVVVGRI